jgi:hypothetical protein
MAIAWSAAACIRRESALTGPSPCSARKAETRLAAVPASTAIGVGG